MDIESPDDAPKLLFGIRLHNKFGAAADLPVVSDRNFGRVTVVLGTNGSGKSRLLQSLSKQVKERELRPVYYIEGGRSITFNIHLSPVADTMYFDSSLEISRRLGPVLSGIALGSYDEITHYKNELCKWVDDGMPPALQPAKPITKFDKISKLFSEIFPHLKLTMDPQPELIQGRPSTDINFKCDNRGKKYVVTSLSDGEKQVLCTLFDVVSHAPDNALIIVDEPELNLHPSLAISLWDSVEQSKKHAFFLYATHSIDFAMRPEVTDVIVLGGPTEEPTHLQAPFEWDAKHLGPFLGALPAIVTTRRALIVEGDGDKSFDNKFYRWLCGRSIPVKNVGSSEEVRAAVRKEGYWSKVGNARLFGIVDRDCHSDESLEKLSRNECYVLPYHEAESYFCHPTILFSVWRKCQGRDDRSEADFTDQLAIFCKQLILETARQRTVERIERRISAGRLKGNLPNDRAKVLEELKDAAQQEYDTANSFVTNAEKFFDEECARCSKAVEEKDVEALLTLFPGKELLIKLAKYANYDSEAFGNVVISAFYPNEFPHLLKLQSVVMKAME